MICNVVPIYAVQQTESVIHTYPKRLAIVPCAVKKDLIDHPFFVFPNPKLPVHPIPLQSPLATTSLFSMSVSLFCTALEKCLSNLTITGAVGGVFNKILGPQLL